MNRAWARGNAPDDVVVAIPIRMLKMGNNENGDGQLNATVSFGSWSNPMRTDDAATNDTFGDVATAFFDRRDFRSYVSFGHVNGQQMVRATIKLPDDAVLRVDDVEEFAGETLEAV